MDIDLSALGIVSAGAFALVLSLAGLLHLAPRLSDALAYACRRAPLLDLIVAAFTWLPWVPSLWVWGWPGLLGCVLGQALGMGAWCLLHESANREAARGPRIVKSLNRMVGRGRNHLALWVTVTALPVFWVIRAAQLVAYQPLVWMLGFPRYRHGEWVNVSRTKFKGLVGHDLIWCLYCDWMTGVYSLGAEMLRNVESFWCPIRFYDGKKCENCRQDFPDIDLGWVSPEGTMADVERLMEEKYADGRREWFGHPARLTVQGRAPREGP